MESRAATALLAKIYETEGMECKPVKRILEGKHQVVAYGPQLAAK